MQTCIIDLLSSPKDYVEILDGIMPTEKGLNYLILKIGIIKIVL